MSEPSEALRQADAPQTQPMETAGSMLRAARQAQSLPVATLALMLKITPRKLEALEDDRYDELQGVTFTRALAQSACRVLKIDPAAVLARLPRAEAGSLGQAGGGLNQPFRERAARRDPMELLKAGRGVLALVGLLLAGAAALWLAPPGFGLSSLPAINWPTLGAASAPAGEETTPDAATVVGSNTAVQPDGTLAPAPGAQAPGQGGTAAPVLGGAPAPSASVPVPHAGLDMGVDPSLDTAAAPAAAATLQLLAREASWIEVLDAKGEALLARTLAPGESVGLDGVLPVRVKIGNAAGTELSFRGQPIDLAPVTRDNVARLQLQ